MSTRGLGEKDWILLHGSGTLQYAYRLGTAYRNLYLHERIAFTFGGAFRGVPVTRFTKGIPLAEADCRPFTEGVWNIRRRQAEAPPGDAYSCPIWIRVEEDGEVEEGLGVTLLHYQGCDWLPPHLTVLAIVSPAVKGKYTGEIRCL